MSDKKPKGRKFKRELLFSIYSRNLSLYMPEYIDTFICPVCRKQFTRDELSRVSLAHIVPRSMGGRHVTLSCSECDNRIGHDCDRHISQEKRHIERVEAKKGIPCKMRWINENKNHAILFDVHRPEIDQLEVHIKPSKNIPPRIWSGYLSRPNNWHNGFQIKMPLFSPERRNLSHIYSSFLLMFSRLGYEYALSPNIDAVCQALKESHSSLRISHLVMDLPKPSFQVPIPSICMMIEPIEMCAFAILMPSPTKGRIRYVFLPGFGKTGENGYHNLLDQVGTHSTIEATIARFQLNKSISDINNEEAKYYGTSVWDALIE